MKLPTLPALEEQLIIDKGEYLIMKSENFKESLAFFRNTQRGEGLKISTAKAYATDVEGFLKFLEEERKVTSLDKISTILITIYRNSLMEKGFSPMTIDRKVISISKFFAFLADNGCLETNPMSRFRHKRQPKDSKVPEYLPFHEIRQIIAAAKRYGDINAKRDSSLLATYAFTGCRREEAVNLDWQQIDFTNKALLLMRSKTSNFDTLPVHKDLYNHLLEYYTERRECLQRYPNPQTPVFYGDKGDRISLKTVNRLFLKYAKLAGIEREFSITPHVFRNSFCTHLAAQGFSLSEIAYLTGHKDLNTLRRYIKLTVNKYKNIDEFI